MNHWNASSTMEKKTASEKSKSEFILKNIMHRRHLDMLGIKKNWLERWGSPKWKWNTANGT